jgi:hypothetical protein
VKAVEFNTIIQTLITLMSKAITVWKTALLFVRTAMGISH